MNKQVKKIFIIILCSIMIFLLISGIVFASDVLSAENKSADALHTLGLFKGTDKGYELDKTLTRAEAVTMIVRLMGKEEYALSAEWEIPFTDVSEWAVPYIGYAFANKITYGISDTEFGSNTTVPYNQFLTMVLRMLGYGESENNYTWDSPYSMAKSLGLIKQTTDINQFVRGNMTDICWSSLFVKGKDNIELYKNLILQRIFTDDDFTKACKINKGKVPVGNEFWAAPEKSSGSSAVTGTNEPANTNIPENTNQNETTKANETTTTNEVTTQIETPVNHETDNPEGVWGNEEDIG